MKESDVVISWEKGLHARPASKLVALAQSFSSNITLRCNEQIASARSILSILLLCATMGSSIHIQAEGEDEDRAIRAIQSVFETTDEAPR